MRDEEPFPCYKGYNLEEHDAVTKFFGEREWDGVIIQLLTAMIQQKQYTRKWPGPGLSYTGISARSG
jgi:hypothetical protein